MLFIILVGVRCVPSTGTWESGAIQSLRHTLQSFFVSQPRSRLCCSTSAPIKSIHLRITPPKPNPSTQIIQIALLPLPHPPSQRPLPRHRPRPPLHTPPVPAWLASYSSTTCSGNPRESPTHSTMEPSLPCQPFTPATNEIGAAAARNGTSAFLVLGPGLRAAESDWGV